MFPLEALQPSVLDSLIAGILVRGDAYRNGFFLDDKTESTFGPWHALDNL